MYFQNKLNCFLINSFISKYEKRKFKNTKKSITIRSVLLFTNAFSQTRTEVFGGGLSPRAFHLGACLVTNGSSACKHAASNPRS